MICGQENGGLPERIVVFRDGVGEEMMHTVAQWRGAPPDNDNEKRKLFSLAHSLFARQCGERERERTL